MLYQVTEAYEKTYNLNNKTKKSLFIIICNLFDSYFNNIESAKQYKSLYYSIKNKDYNTYMLVLKSKKY